MALDVCSDQMLTPQGPSWWGFFFFFAKNVFVKILRRLLLQYVVMLVFIRSMFSKKR